MAAAARAGHSWPTTCRGQAECGACATEVAAGADQLLPPTDLELAALFRLPPSWAGRRLARQLRVVGPATLRKVAFALH